MMMMMIAMIFFFQSLPSKKLRSTDDSKTADLLLPFHKTLIRFLLFLNDNRISVRQTTAASYTMFLFSDFPLRLLLGIIVISVMKY